MKYLLLSLILCSCTFKTATYQVKAPCKVSNQVLFERLTGVLVSEGLQIKTVTSNYLLAESTPETGEHNALHTKIWAVTVNSDTVRLNAKRRYQNNGYTFETDLHDLKADVSWYWNVRNEIESACGNKVIIDTVMK